ncbi:bifunctional lytic transglycosylase/C40 family peptidase [Bacillus cereus group sp. TH177-1LC]|uniref:bifunctional lytic transglycosylase/C40 family peptidase n=1 Tax=Bacillus cereus group sp. TH177-1LC TaxID=3018055 RepID=UPI0022E54766|nr:bifunctional lytic transglycosylase/C40 family peptidase [Bacillus cereus group sp. TH177-1LC]MDA1642129.1 bifunctional lytic transglycosylase/C40 family peptidase [Bacillus cereus group sp. TH177-1LC]
MSAEPNRDFENEHHPEAEIGNAKPALKKAGHSLGKAAGKGSKIAGKAVAQVGKKVAVKVAQKAATVAVAKPLLIVAGVILAVVAGLGIVIFLLTASMSEDEVSSGGIGGPFTPGTASVSPEVMRWEPLVRKYAAQHGIEAMTPLILALIQQESSGTQLDVMQSSESQGYGPGYFTDPEESIKYGLMHFADCHKKSNGDPNITLQCYNYGTGYANYALSNGGYTHANARAFSAEQTAKTGYKCASWRSAEAVANNWCYGDPDYVPHVLRYYQGGSGGGPVAGGDELFKKVMDEAIKYQGWPYVWGGRTPQSSFDCSGLIQWVYGQAGINLVGTAETQFKMTQRTNDPQPGDLIFFQGTYKPGISHIGIYVGNNRMFHAGDPIGYADLNTPYWQQHFAGYGRVAR